MNESEDSDHVFLNCDYVKELRLPINGWAKIIGHIHSIFSSLTQMASPLHADKKNWKLFWALIVVFWAIWRSKNDYIFKQKKQNLMKAVEK
ncbi:hypothetical protein LXL04_032686 [Taraxacum kok-saghyz]